MFKKTRIIWTFILMLLLLLLAGCSGDTGDGGGDPIYPDEDLESTRDFIISDQFPYPGKKSDCTVLDKQTNNTFSIYIYIITKGEAWKKNNVKDIAITYHDNNRPGVVIEYDQISTLSHEGKTYIRVDDISYPEDAQGYFKVEGEIKQGSHWYPKSSQSNLFNYGNPGDDPIPINRDYILYEKEYVD